MADWKFYGAGTSLQIQSECSTVQSDLQSPGINEKSRARGGCSSMGLAKTLWILLPCHEKHNRSHAKDNTQQLTLIGIWLLLQRVGVPVSMRRGGRPRSEEEEWAEFAFDVGALFPQRRRDAERFSSCFVFESAKHYAQVKAAV